MRRHGLDDKIGIIDVRETENTKEKEKENDNENKQHIENSTGSKDTEAVESKVTASVSTPGETLIALIHTFVDNIAREIITQYY